MKKKEITDGTVWQIIKSSDLDDETKEFLAKRDMSKVKKEEEESLKDIAKDSGKKVLKNLIYILTALTLTGILAFQDYLIGSVT